MYQIPAFESPTEKKKLRAEVGAEAPRDAFAVALPVIRWQLVRVVSRMYERRTVELLALLVSAFFFVLVFYVLVSLPCMYVSYVAGPKFSLLWTKISILPRPLLVPFVDFATQGYFKSPMRKQPSYCTISSTVRVCFAWFRRAVVSATFRNTPGNAGKMCVLVVFCRIATHPRLLKRKPTGANHTIAEERVGPGGMGHGVKTVGYLGVLYVNKSQPLSFRGTPL